MRDGIVIAGLALYIHLNSGRYALSLVTNLVGKYTYPRTGLSLEDQQDQAP